MIPIKLSFNGEVRRVTLYSQEKLNFVTLRDAAYNLFPGLREKDLTFLWSDDECDLVCCSSTEEVEEAVRVMTAESKTTFRFNVSVSERPEVAGASSGVAHPNVTCDGCGQSPIVGPRFKCAVREDFDLCSRCEASTVQPHAMLKIYQPSQAPSLLVVGVADQDGDFHQFEHPGRRHGHGHGHGHGWRRGCGRGGRGGGWGRGCPWMRRQEEPASQSASAAEGTNCGAGSGAGAGGCASTSTSASTSAAAGGEGCSEGEEAWGRRRGPRGCHWAKKMKEHGWNWDKLNSMLSRSAGPLAEELLSVFMPPQDQATATPTTCEFPCRSAQTQSRGTASDDIDEQILNDVLRMSLEESEAQAGAVRSVSAPSAPDSEAAPAPAPAPVAQAPAPVVVEAPAPSAPPAFSFVWDPVPEVPVPVSVSVSAPVPDRKIPALYSMRFVADESIPDGTVVKPGVSFQKVWRVKNSGKVAWPHNVRLVSSGGDELVAPDSWFEVPAVEAGAEVSLAVTMTAPRHAGRHVAYFRLSVDGEHFGIRLWADIRVEEESDEDCSSPSPSAPPAGLIVEDVNSDDEDSEYVPSAFSAPRPPVLVTGRVVPTPTPTPTPTPSLRTPVMTSAVPAPHVSVPPPAPYVPVSSAWASELNALAEMGFTDQSLLLSLLQTHVDPSKPENERSRGLQTVINMLV